MTKMESLGLEEPTSRFGQIFRRHEQAVENAGNSIAILRHAHSVVEEQIPNATDEESKKRLIRLKERLEREISTLETESTSTTSEMGLRRMQALGIATAVAGAALIGLGIYLIANKSESIKPEPI
jgi:hypothetical protein